jgi:polar amino acid transport system substrate-binding protein
VATSSGVPGLIEADIHHPGQFTGIVPELVGAVGDCLGFKYKMTALSFNGVIPAVTAGRFDMAAASMYDTPERRQQVTYVDYDTVAEFGVVPKGNPKHLNSLADTCGLTTAAAAGSQELLYLSAQSDKCKREGKPGLKVLQFDTTDTAFQALISGRVSFVLNGASANLGFLGGHSNFERAFPPTRGPAEGMQFPKSSTTLINAVYAAMKIIQSSGTQQQIIDANHLKGQNLVLPTVIGS